jgi:NAD(P)-dependent dehydrogenase (short-subunit alcohol dehydrogenase family)
VTRFENITFAFPNTTEWPILQTDFAPEARPDCGEESYVGHGRLVGRHALITGGDSGIGRAVAIAYMREGATVAINYLPAEEADAQDLADLLLEEFPDRPLIQIPGNLLNQTFCDELVDRAVEQLGALDILVNNAG